MQVVRRRGTNWQTSGRYAFARSSVDRPGDSVRPRIGACDSVLNREADAGRQKERWFLVHFSRFAVVNCHIVNNLTTPVE
jgi:hypothetical protein